MGVGCLAPLLGETCRFRAHHDGGGLAHVVVVVLVGVLQLGGEDLYLMRLEEGDALLGGADGRGDTEDSADAGADDVGIIDIRQWVADDDGIHPSGLRRTQYGSQVAWLLHALENDN